MGDDEALLVADQRLRQVAHRVVRAAQAAVAAPGPEGSSSSVRQPGTAGNGGNVSTLVIAYILQKV